MRAVEALLRESIDYAGLFPPAALDLETTVRNYAAYRSGPDAWALGRLVLPAAKLAEFGDRWPNFVATWPISLLLGADFDTEMRLAIDTGFALDVVECRPATLADVAAIRRRMPRTAMLFVEPPVGVALEHALAVIADARACAKLRAGGVTAEAVPNTGLVAEFLLACARRGVRLKATAGLHHAIRAEHRLTCEPNAPTARMHGFVNFFLAAAAAQEGGDRTQVEEILEAGSRDAFQARDDSIRWRRHIFAAETIERLRTSFAISFGSCSFAEPTEEMRAMRWIE